MIKSLTQTVDNGAGGTTEKETTYELDPTGRINTVSSKSGGSEASRLRYSFSGESDSPSGIATSNDAGANWNTTRYVTLPGLGMIGSVTGANVTYQIANLHGDVVATQAQQPGTPTISDFRESDEYGNALTTSIGRYGWLGSHQRSADSTGGVLLMGARIYNPASGLFLSPDPVLNGGANRYSYPTDPVNQLDLTGQLWGWLKKAGLKAAAFGLKVALSVIAAGLCGPGALLCRGIMQAGIDFAWFMVEQAWIKGKTIASRFRGQSP